MEYTKEDEVRFWSSVNVSRHTNGCWYWRKSKHAYGYGYFRLNKKTYCSHKLALIMFYGEDKTPLQVLHSCDNPVCCNPKHLRWGTANDNVQDAIKRHRKTDPPTNYGEKHPSSKLNWEKVDKIREARSNGEEMKDIALRYGVAIQTIYRIISFHNWKPEYRKEGSL